MKRQQPSVLLDNSSAVTPTKKVKSHHRFVQHPPTRDDAEKVSPSKIILAIQKPPAPSLERVGKQTETGMDGSDRHDGHPPYDHDGDVLNSFTWCDVTVTFCDKDRNPRSQFVVGKPVYVMLTFTNNNENKMAYIHMERGTFRQNGIRLIMPDNEGLLGKVGIPCCHYTAGTCGEVVVALAKGESYTFFRILCAEDAAAAKKRRIYYYSPAASDQAGEYGTGMKLRYAGYEKELSGYTLKFVNNQEEEVVPDLAVVSSD